MLNITKEIRGLEDQQPQFSNAGIGISQQILPQASREPI